MNAALIAVPLIGGLVAAFAGERARVVSLVTLLVGLALTFVAWSGSRVVDVPWIVGFGADIRLVLDGLSLPLILLTWGLGLVALGASADIHDRVGFYHLNLMWVLAGVVGVFLAHDLLLFFVFWELMLVPMYLLIGIWGYGDRVRAALQFFVFTQASGLLMFVAILALYVGHLQTTGTGTFDYDLLRATRLPPGIESALMWCFFLAFAVKVPAVPLHTWLPVAHTEAPTGGSVILAGLLLKTGAYGMIRFLVPLFPGAAERWAPLFMALGVVGILYGAWLAFAQTDAKRLVAYSSVSHMGFVLLAIFAWNEIALKGALMEMICHGLSTGGLFVVVGMLQKRYGTRDLRELGGLWADVPKLGAMGLAFALASLALPGFGNFVAEFLCLLGAWQTSPAHVAVAAVGLVWSAVYSLVFVQRAFQGPLAEPRPARDLRPGEAVLYAGMLAVLLWLGLYPQPVLDVADATIRALAPTTTVEGT